MMEHIDSEAYLESVGLTHNTPEPFTQEEREILGKILTSKVTKKAFRHLAVFIEVWKQQVFGSSLLDPAQVGNALKHQGMAEGVTMALVVLVDMANEKPETSGEE